MARRHRRRGSFLAVGASFGGFTVLAVGLLLGGLSFQKLLVAAAASDGERVINRLQNGEPVGQDGLDRARGSFRAAMRGLPSDYRAPRDLALIELMAAQRLEPANKDRGKLLQASIDAAHASLANNPAQPYVWLRLAQAELQVSGVGVEAALAFTMSLETGPQVLDLMQPRVVLGLILWPILDDRQQNRVLAQIRGLARYNPRVLAETVLNRPGLPQVRQALADDKDLMEEFTRWYLQRRSRGLRRPDQ